METIIQQITADLKEEILKKACSEKITNLDSLAADIFEDCAKASCLIVQEIIKSLNQKIRNDKESRKKIGFVLKESNRPRQIHTKLGTVEFKRDYYFNKKEGNYVYLLDTILGIEKYERIGATIVAQMLNCATEMSYQKSAEFVSGNAVSRQSVRNHLLKLDIPEKEPTQNTKIVKELHIFADEDHVHMQKPGKKKGKKNQIVPLVTVTEGVEKVSDRRNKTINAMHFVDEKQSSKNLWKSVDGYIKKAYDVSSIEKIYIHADGGKWIQSGMEDFAQTVRVMDGYHLNKELCKISKNPRARMIRQVVVNALKSNDKDVAEKYFKNINSSDKLIESFRTYLYGNWEAIRNLVILDTVGSCTEGQVSHILSQRFSRNPMGWSKEGLGKLSKLRVYIKNGGKLKGEDLRAKTTKETYSEYSDLFTEKHLKSSYDFSIFEPEQYVMNGKSATQILIKHYGTNYGINI